MTKKVVTQAANFSAASRYKERGLSCPLFLFFNLLKVVLQNIFTITRIQVFPDSIRNPFARMTVTNDSESNFVSFHHNQANMKPLVGEAFAPLKYNSCEQQFVRKSAQLHGITKLSGEEFSAIE